MIIYKDFKFSAAHMLTKVPEEHPCSHVHGHNYTVRISLKGPVRDDGMVMDYHELKEIWQECCGKLDHSYLNAT
ncbi:unnamed protein product, partial [marine sediment metagenome]